MTQVRLITVGLVDYPKVPKWNVIAEENSALSVRNSLEQHGVLVEDWTPDASQRRLLPKLNKWTACTKEAHILYWIGHGQFNEEDGYQLALASSEEPLRGHNSLTDQEIAEFLRNQLKTRGIEGLDQWVLLILDTCDSFEGMTNIYRILKSPRNTVILATTPPESGAGFESFFPSALESVLSDFNGNDTAGIPLYELVSRLTDALHCAANVAQGSFDRSLYLPLRVTGELHAPGDVYAELQAMLKDSPDDLKNHFYAKAQGAEIGEPAWYFVGRETERQQVANWLRRASDGMFVVSGLAGSGKSALLGMLLATTDDDVTTTIGRLAGTAVPDHVRPRGVRFDVVIHLSGLTVTEAVAALAKGLRLNGVGGADELIEQTRERNVDRTTILADALDEARDPLTIAALLRRLATVPSTRVLVGTRQSLYEDPDTPVPPDRDVLDVLGVKPDSFMILQRDPDAIRTYVRQRLAATLHAQLGTDRINEIAETIAQAPQPFLFAHLAIRELIADPARASSPDRFAELLATGHRGIFGQTVARIAVQDPAVERLLHVLAYARGHGFPRTDGIWALAVSAISDATVDDTDVERTLQLAAPYIMYSSEAGQSVHRLAHRTFIEHYHAADRLSSDSIETRVASSLMRRLAAMRDGQPSPYLVRYLAEHIGAGELWDRLAEQPALLDRLDPTSVRREAFRLLYGRGDLPAAVAVAMVAGEELAGQDQDGRRLTRHLTACRLGLTSQLEAQALIDPRVQWAHLHPVHLHLSLTGHTRLVSRVAFGVLPDGRVLLASVGVDETVRLWDPATGTPVADAMTGHTGHTSQMSGVAFGVLPDGRALLATSDEDTVRLWDPATGSPVGSPLTGETLSVRDVAFGTRRDGRVLLVVHNDARMVRVWDPPAAGAVGHPLIDIGLSVGSVAFGTLRDGRTLLAAARSDGSVRLWDPATGRPVGAPLTPRGRRWFRRRSRHAGQVRTDAFGAPLTPRGRRWFRRRSRNIGPVRAVAFGALPNGRLLLASASTDWTVRLWDPATGSPIGDPLTGHAGWVNELAFGTLADGRLVLASASDDGTVRLWDPVTGSPIGAPLTGHTAWVNGVAFGTLSDGRVLVASASEDGTVRLWDPVTGSPIGDPLTGHSHAVHGVAFGTLSDGRVLLASAGVDETVRLSDPALVAPASDPSTGHTDEVIRVAFGTLSDGRVLLATSGTDKTVRLWDAASGIPAGVPLTRHTGVGPVKAVAFGRLKNGRVLLATSDERTVRAWDPGTGSQVGDLRTGHTDVMTDIAFATLPDGRVLLATSDRQTVRVWAAATASLIGDPLTGPLTAMAFGTLADGRVLLATAVSDGTVKLSDPSTGSQIGDPLTGHTGSVYRIAFGTLSDGRLVMASASFDDTVRLWDPVTGSPIGDPLTDHDTVTDIAFTTLPDGRVLLATKNYHTVRLWSITGQTPARVWQSFAFAPSMPRALAVHGSLLVVACDDGVVALRINT